MAAVSDLTVILTIDTTRAQRALERVAEDLTVLAELVEEACPHATIHVDTQALVRDMFDRYIDWSVEPAANSLPKIIA